jgi:predicted HTH transcriptional regulator
MADNNQLSVRFARFNDAGERFELIEKAIEYGNCCLITAIQRILDRYEIENITMSKLTGAAHRIDKRLVDAKCLREVIINAFAHNDYSYGMLPIFEVFQNRFAIRSYGGLVPQLTVNDFFMGVSALRNPELMRILKDLELVEALGFGIRGITKVYDRNIFEFTDNTIYVQFPFEKEVVDSESNLQSNLESNLQSNLQMQSNLENNLKSNLESRVESKDKILELIAHNPKLNIYAIANYMNYSVSGVKKMIKQLKEEGRIIHTGSRKNGEWVIDKSNLESNLQMQSNLKSNLQSRVESKDKVLELIAHNPKLNILTIAELMNYSVSGVKKVIKQLKEEGRIIHTGSRKNGEWVIKKVG